VIGAVEHNAAVLQLIERQGAGRHRGDDDALDDVERRHGRHRRHEEGASGAGGIGALLQPQVVNDVIAGRQQWRHRQQLPGGGAEIHHPRSNTGWRRRPRLRIRANARPAQLALDDQTDQARIRHRRRRIGGIDQRRGQPGRLVLGNGLVRGRHHEFYALDAQLPGGQGCLLRVGERRQQQQRYGCHYPVCPPLAHRPLSFSRYGAAPRPWPY